MIKATIAAFVFFISFGTMCPASANSISRPYDQGITNEVSDGSCICKRNCNQFAVRGQLAGEKLKQCKSDCEQTYSGCTKGTLRR